MRIILAKFPDHEKAYGSLAAFFNEFPEYEIHRDNINTYLTRKKQPYVHNDFTLVRLEVIKSQR